MYINSTVQYCTVCIVQSMKSNCILSIVHHSTKFMSKNSMLAIGMETINKHVHVLKCRIV